MNTSIASIHGREILDSRGNPTIEVEVKLESGVIGRAAAPSGASTGKHEALELRDNDEKRYLGKGVLRAVKNVNELIHAELRGGDVGDLRSIDHQLMELDGTDDKSRLGANAMVSVSLACAQAGARERGEELFEYIRAIYGLDYMGKRLPRPLMNIVNGGKHADNKISIQEFLIIPKADTMSEMIRMGTEVFHHIQMLLIEKGKSSLVGDEGGVAPYLKSDEEAFEYILEAIQRAGYTPQHDIDLGIDAAASEWYDPKTGRYHIQEAGRDFTSEEIIVMYETWVQRFHLSMIEDGLAEDDWGSWQKMTTALGSQCKLIGDDLFVTNLERLHQGVEEGVANGVIIKPNQIGTLTESIDVIEFAQMNDYVVTVSHRSGETSDTSIADIAVAVQSDFLKAGAPSRGERVAKYNRLLAIEESDHV